MFSDLEGDSALSLMDQVFTEQGFLFLPATRAEVEAGDISRCRDKLQRQLGQSGPLPLTGRVVLTLTGWADDPRELPEIPEAREFWRRLDEAVPELPILLAELPDGAYVGPTLYVMMTSEIAEQRVTERATVSYEFYGTQAERRASLIRLITDRLTPTLGSEVACHLASSFDDLVHWIPIASSP